MNNKIILAITFLVMSFNCSLAFAAPDEIYLFRHSEKLTGKNPALSEEGKARANNLVTLFKEHQSIHIFSSNYKRTLQTASPLQAYFNTDINVYNAGELSDLKNELLKLKGVVVVIGHSNTTPQLAELLSNEKVPAMSETQFTQYFILNKKPSSNGSEYDVTHHKMSF
ncbi:MULTISPECIES: SixA phosphatase family protein [Pseudoalteromonas]|uniref:SixA phosphatase family protein n=1 Tax=Pseudoalteromonas TaxID=53246 RepID=UPI000C33896E|nr:MULTISPECIES: histidine phosphatase family protein [Pseudoalteromonas]PKG66927.1 histidine phosphatase family protein [Pseudoalteromonas arctica]PKG72020.1 histidine phosphatase family protein [Pseudoalteromonas sp. GutCa3]